MRPGAGLASLPEIDMSARTTAAALPAASPSSHRRASRPAKGSKGFRACRTTGKDDWGSPPPLIAALGPFDLDPCSWPAAQRKHFIAPLCFTKADNGLTKPWPEDDFVWLNPPYGRQTRPFLDKLAQHPAGGIALVFARTDTRWAQELVFEKAHGVVFVQGRLRFLQVRVPGDPDHCSGARASRNRRAGITGRELALFRTSSPAVESAWRRRNFRNADHHRRRLTTGSRLRLHRFSL